MSIACTLCLVFLVKFAIANDSDSRQTLLFLGEKGPLVIEIELTKGDLPFVEAWRKGLIEVVNELDKDGDGMLSRAETDPPEEKKPPIPPGQPAVAEKITDKKPKKPLTPPLLQTANLWDADAEPSDGKLSIEELTWFLSRQGQGPFQTEANQKTGAMQSPQVTMTNNSGQRLWGWLDEDGNSQLSVEEIRAAGRTLKKYDLDADETISLNELEGVENPFFSARQSNQNTETPFFAVMREQSATPIIRRLMQRYKSLNEPFPGPKDASGKTDQTTEVVTPKRPPGLSMSLLKIPESQRHQFDRDGNGGLDDWELRAYLKSPVPMVRILVRLPIDENSEPLIEGEVTGENSSVVVKKSAAGSISIMAGEIQIEIDAGGLRPETLRQSLEERFKQSDFDNNGYLEQNEANRDLFFRNHFQNYDLDGDGKLYPEEWQPPVLAAIKLSAAQTRMVVQDAGQDVFTVLDSDRNLKISPREWLSAADRMSVWDKNESGTLETAEVPHVYRVSLGPGLPTLPGLLAPNNNNQQMPTVQQLVKGPKWFQAMDKNSDGDVSPKEFLGKPELFQLLDQDKDNLIDPREAARFSE
jgi:Ca2+-binding EF-hand superfamily protein